MVTSSKIDLDCEDVNRKVKWPLLQYYDLFSSHPRMGRADDELSLVTEQLQADSGDSHGEHEKEEADDIQERDLEAPEEVLFLYVCFA